MANQSDINGDFKRATESYADGELVLLIDGSGGMPFAFGNQGPNPFVIAVEYGVQAKALSTNQVSAFTFSDPEKAHPPIPLDGKEPAEKYFPQGASCFMPAFDDIVERYEAGNIRHPAHIVIVSDGEISESNGRDRQDVLQKMLQFLRDHREVMLDVIIPGTGETGFTGIIRDLAKFTPENPPRMFVVESAGNLRNTIANVINERSNAVENLAETMRSGVDKPSTMRALRFRKPPETV